MAKAMGVIPAGDVFAADAMQKQVGTIYESVTTFVQALDGTSGSLSSKISQDSIDKLSSCKAKLELLLTEDTDRMAEGGPETKEISEVPQSEGEGYPRITLINTGKSVISEDPWVLQAYPQSLSVNRRVIASSRLVAFFERRRKFELFALANVVFAVLLFLTYKKIGSTLVKVTFTNEQGITRIAEFPRPHSGVYALMLFWYFFGLWLALHRMNRTIFFTTLFSFDGIACAGSQMCAGLIQFWNYQQVLGSQFDAAWMTGEITYRLLQCFMLAPIVAGLDGLRFGRKIVMFGQFCVLVGFVKSVISIRCQSKEFPEELMICQPSLLTFREMGSSLVVQATIFVAKSLFAKSGGSTFGIIHPHYVPASQVAKQGRGLVARTSRRLSQMINSGNDITSKPVPPQFKGVERQGGDDSAPESFTKPATSSGDLEDNTEDTTTV